MSSPLPSRKRYGTAVCLAAIFGVLGIHHFYLGCWLHGLFDLGLTLLGIILLIAGHPTWGFAALAIDYLHTLVVTILLLIGAYKDGRGRIVRYPGQRLLTEQPSQ